MNLMQEELTKPIVATKASARATEGNPLAAVRHLLQYNWHDEQQDFREADAERAARHVFNYCQTIRQWLEDLDANDAEILPLVRLPRDESEPFDLALTKRLGDRLGGNKAALHRNLFSYEPEVRIDTYETSTGLRVYDLADDETKPRSPAEAYVVPDHCH